MQIEMQRSAEQNGVEQNRAAQNSAAHNSHHLTLTSSSAVQFEIAICLPIDLLSPVCLNVRGLPVESILGHQHNATTTTTTTTIYIYIYIYIGASQGGTGA